MDKKVLPLPFFAALRGPSWKKVLPLPFFAALRGPSWTKRCCRCRSSRPFGPFVDKKVLPLPFFAALRGPSWKKRCCRCRSSRPFAALRGQKGVAVAVLRGPSWPFVDKKVLPLPLRGPSGKRCPRPDAGLPRPFGVHRPFVDKKVLPLPFFAALRRQALRGHVSRPCVSRRRSLRVA